MTIIGHGYGGKYATPISHGYGKQTVAIVLYRTIYNDMSVTDSIMKPMAINCGTEKFGED